MRNKITMEMSICQAENGFSLDELVKKFTDAFENKVFAEILKMNLQLTQEVLIYRIFNGKSNQQCCPDGHLTLNGSFERRIRTSPGEVKMDFWRVRCSKFADYATEQQRCHWHIKRDLYHMMYQEGGRYRDSKPIQDALAGVLAIYKYFSQNSGQ